MNGVAGLLALAARALAAPTVVAEAPLAQVRERLDEAEQVIRDVDRVADGFFAAYDRFVAPLIEPSDAMPAGFCRDRRRARSVFLARRAVETYAAAIEHLTAASRLSTLSPPAAMTPPTRRRLAHLAGAGAEATRTLSLMRALEASLLRRELSRHGCDLAQVEEIGTAVPETDETEAALVPATEPEAAPVSIHVDNRHCDRSFEVVVDGRALGHAPPRVDSWLDAPDGWRRFCLTQSGENTCRRPDRRAVVYLHTGWSIRPYCE